ncbi:sulfate ABC transporter permease subunit CysW [Brucella sp. ZJ1_1]|uniref:Sulfate ABC transporter, permease protein CysW n=2 Tax=Brucella intermedia TaxID=94625 RepID=C4WEC4_9HYPH|nr:sulfate ABC transporter permease subunit CysW [Brucella intermedia]KAB2669346.1 sulfate ABC transporter permease subunit CysW [Ochrobactrum sp. LMG 5442]EEQ96053.1 sulfate ABC transporter, permease protein CysW [Brucella intermedia LMG 3301]ELT48959.1 sulfate ABC transporter permease [Brucella intermedia M86]MCB4917632.1 sulfate ABC transporter permease subunit CysW [Brucella intermedia]OOC51379.1 sulfate ABC transporter permease [Brucella intermedia M86]
MQNASASMQARNSGPMRSLLIWLAALLSVICIGAPLAVIFSYAFSKGVDVFFSEILKPDTLHAVWLTILTAIVVVPINMAFGVCVAWLVTKFRFPGRRLLITFVEIPFSVSPIVAGVTYLFLYGSQGLLGPLLESYDIKIMFTVPAIFLVSLFVTSPFVARELIPLMEVQGSDEEEAALTLGANAWQTFFYVTLPNIKWALLYGAVLCNARVMGEFGATSVVSGAIRGKTNTLPLQVELLFNDYNVAGAFAAASTLALIALVTLVLKILLERRQGA